LALAFLAAGCATPGTTTTAVTYVAVRGGSITLGIAQSPTGCNPNTPLGDTPATNLILSAVLPSPYLVSPTGAAAPTQPDPNLIVQSELVSTKPETIVYTLNPHAVWSDGTPITAKDFIYAWQQQRLPQSFDQQPTVASVAGYRDIASVTGTNRGRTVTVIFHTPFADWQMLFANLLPAHVMEKVGWDPTCATVDPAIDLSGGPFKIARATSSEVDLVSNPKWWGTPPDIRRLNVRIASGPDQLAQWMQSGAIQVAAPSAVTPAYLTEMTSLPGAQSTVNLSSTILQLEMAAGPDSPLPPDTRFAIALSIDRQALVTQQADWALPSIEVANSHIYVQGQTGYKLPPGASNPPSATTTTSPSTSSTLIGQGGSVNFPTTPQLAQAAQLMVASGFARDPSTPWREAFGPSFTLHLVVDDGDPWAAAAAPQVVSQLEAAGYAVTLYSVPSEANAGSVLANGYADLALVPRTSTPYLSQSLAWYSTLLGPPGQNGSQDWSGYSNTDFNQLITAASEQLMPSTAATDYANADTKLWDDMVALPLFAEPSTLVWSRSVGGIVPDPKGNSLLWYAQNWAMRVPESTANTTPQLPNQ
jgi:peptide/nickel transport system substrate-binding protein